MRDLSNLKRLSQLKKEAININEDLKKEIQKLTEKRNELIEDTLKNFIEELSELSKYGSAGYTGIKLDFYRSSYGERTELIHNSEGSKFRLLANSLDYGSRVLYDSESGWNWYKNETKKFIAMNKDRILDVIEEKIAQSITDYIKDSKVIDTSIQLKQEIEYIMRGE